MEVWGAALFGEPCRECGFEWSITALEAVAWVRVFEQHARQATGSLAGEARLDGWSVAEYISHVGDNLRQWAERIQAARLAGRPDVAGYDPDALAKARGYAHIPLEVALWSAGSAAHRWADVLVAAIDEGVELQHSTRGLQRAEDVARNNCHDAYHHIWDIRRITGASTFNGRRQLIAAEPPNHYLGADQIIQSDHPDVVALGQELRDRHAGDAEFAEAAFDWVRDNIAHAYDAQDHRVTLTASQVLAEGVGLCYAKSSLLAAILRSQGIPTGLCYQRLGNLEDGHVLHGLVAVHLDGAWHRQDPRGNKAGIDAQFSLGTEQVAYVIDENKGEQDYPRVYVSAADEVVNALQGADDILICPLPSDLSSS